MRGLTAAEAAAIARRHGLTLSDAVALAALADNADEADTLAAMFARDADRREKAPA